MLKPAVCIIRRTESQKTFQQMSQKDALKLAKDVYEFDLKATYSGAASWVTPAEQSIADEIVIDSQWFPLWYKNLSVHWYNCVEKCIIICLVFLNFKSNVCK
jgi:hypothetical protein